MSERHLQEENIMARRILSDQTASISDISEPPPLLEWAACIASVLSFLVTVLRHPKFKPPSIAPLKAPAWAALKRVARVSADLAWALGAVCVFIVGVGTVALMALALGIYVEAKEQLSTK